MLETRRDYDMSTTIDRYLALRMRVALALAFIVITFAAAGSPAFADKAERDAADVLFAAGELGKAGDAYEAYLAANEEDGYGWFRLAYARHMGGDYTAASTAYERADALGFAPILTKYNHACVLAKMGDADAAWTTLENALEAGYGDGANLEADEELMSLRKRDGFADLVERANRNGAPCEYDERFREFDFWIGEWEVLMTNGARAGTNRIERAIKGCVLIENWSSSLGGTGMSMNYFDASIDKWRQDWVDASGGGIHYVGGLVDGEMVFEGDNYNPDGTSQLSRMTFTPNDDGTVRQYIEQSEDEGKTWAPWFDGLYKPLEGVSQSR